MCELSFFSPAMKSSNGRSWIFFNWRARFCNSAQAICRGWRLKAKAMIFTRSAALRQATWLSKLFSMRCRYVSSFFSSAMKLTAITPPGRSAAQAAS